MLEGRTIIVTGAARGLGRVMALALLGEGATVGAIDLPVSAPQTAELKQAAAQAGAASRLYCFEADITSPEQIHAAVEAITVACGPIFGLVNNAGRGPQEIGPMARGGRRKPFHELDIDTWRGIMDSNLNGPFLMAHTVAPLLVRAGRGRIVNVVTSFHTMQAEGFSPYGPSKAGLEAATVIWAKDLAGTGVTVNALLPGGAADTRMIPVEDVPDRESLVQPVVMHAPIIWLMSDASEGVTGQRVIGKNWDPAAPVEEAAKSACRSAGFPI
jgi:NAD(P)-dependent dehydrogenase (short-subunit alcohol dehydrogenase family)